MAIDDLIDEFLDDTFARSPVMASALGVEGYEDQLDDLSADAIGERYQKAAHWLKVFADLPDEPLALEQRVDRDLILSHLRGAKLMEVWAPWQRDPGYYLGPALQGVHSLFLHKLFPPKDLAYAAAARMQAVPRIVEDGRRNLIPAKVPPLFAERALGMCRAGVGYFRKLVPDEAEDEASRRLLVDAGETAAAAFEKFGSHIEKLVSRGKGDWSIGEPLYDSLLIDKEMLGYGTREMLARGREQFEVLSKEMASHTKAWKGTEDWKSVNAELQQDSAFETADDVRDDFERWTRAARQFLMDGDLVTLPVGEECRVVPSPAFTRPILAVASYSAPPPFKPTRVGHFFVPYPPDGVSADEARARARGNGSLGIPTTAVHEAYPGHHWHLVKMKDNPRRIRKVIRTAYFTEGWALYAEKMMREEGFFEDPAHELGHLSARIFRAARMIVDTSLHIGEMSPDDAAEFLLENLGGAEQTIRTEVGRYCSWPTQAPSYLTGSLEIERMRERFFTEGRGTLKEFHDTIATLGGLPIGLAEKALLG